MATAAEVVELNETARQRLIRIVDDLMFDGGDQREAFARAAEAVNTDDAFLQELWAEVGPQVASMLWRLSQGRVPTPPGLNPSAGERIVDMKAIRNDSALYRTAYTIDGRWRRFRDLTKSDAGLIADDYERRRGEMAALVLVWRRIEKKLAAGKTISDQFPTHQKLREILTPKMAQTLGVKQ